MRDNEQIESQVKAVEAGVRAGLDMAVSDKVNIVAAWDVNCSKKGRYIRVETLLPPIVKKIVMADGTKVLFKQFEGAGK